MSSYFIKLSWIRENDFSYETFNRTHDINFSGEQILKSSSAPEYLGEANKANPEEMLAAAVSSCHMLTFLAIASKSGYIVDMYQDRAEAQLHKNEEGKIAITQINLNPSIEFSGAKQPDANQLKSLHEKAHRNCFVANSIKTKVQIQ